MIPEKYAEYVKRVVCRFSCGAASAVATKVTLKALSGDCDVVVQYLDTGSEHPDNQRFLLECESWFGVRVERLKSEKYSDIWEVFEDVRFLSGVHGAPCTRILKRAVGDAALSPNDDLVVMGYTADKSDSARAVRLCENNPEIMFCFPLIQEGITKAHCLSILSNVGIEIPAMYRLGYNNNNCIGCVKGGIGYWNKIRRDFPEVFERMAKLERKIQATRRKKNADVAMLRRKRDGMNTPLYLDELDPNDGRAPEPMSCDMFCSVESEQIAAALKPAGEGGSDE